MRTPSADLVVLSWLRQVPGLTSNIASSIPRDDSGKVNVAKWGDKLTFVTGLALPGGSVDLGTSDGVVPVQIECWARPEAAGNKVPWERAAAITEVIRKAAESGMAYAELPMPSPYLNVVMEGLEMESPYRAPDDPLRYARYLFTMYFYYFCKDE